MYRFDYDTYNSSTCCGVEEVGDFEYTSRDEAVVKQYKMEGFYPTKKEAYEHGLQNILANNRHYRGFGRPIIFWFMKEEIDNGKYDEDFEHEELRQLVLEHPGQVYLGTFVNPNTGNIIEGYMIKHNVREIKE